MSLLQDVQFAARSLRNHRGFTTVAVATLALGIGANAAMFAVVNAVILEPLPFPEPDRLVRVTADLAGLGASDIGMSPPELYDYRDRSELFESISGVYPIDANLTEVDEPERVEVLLVSPTYFELLGVRPQLGRVFDATDNHPGIAEVVVISDALWRRRFGGRADAIGRKLKIDGDFFEVVGVAPPGFRHPGRVLRTGIEMWAPSGYRAAPFQPLERSRGGYALTGAIARLKSGVSLEEANERLRAFAARLRSEHPNDYPSRSGWTPRLIDLHEDMVGRTSAVLVTMLAAVGVVLAIACANIAGLLLARGAGRQRELAIRRALGADRLRLARLLLVESALLACCGAVVGLVLAFWAKDAILSLAPAGAARLGEVTIDLRVMLFTAAVAAITGLLFGLAPAWQFSKPDLQNALKDVRTASSPARQRVRSTLVVAECALAMVLLVGAALLVRSFWRVMQIDPGIDARNVLTARLWLPQPNDPTVGRYFRHQARVPFFEEVIRRARALPGVEAAAIAQSLPLDGQRGMTTITIDGANPETASDVPTVQGNIVSLDYFAVMRIPLRQGRVFDATDGADGRAAVINEEMARRYFPGQDPIGRRFSFGRPRPDAPWFTIIGVVGNVLSENLEVGARPMMYRPLSQASSLSMAVALRTSGDPSHLAVALTRVVRSVDPDQPTFAVRTMEEVQAAGMASRRFAIRLIGGFAVLALVLAAIGIYGVMAHLVGQQTREIGIRIALGARRSEVIGGVVRPALTLAAAGVAAGGVISLVAGPALEGMLFRIAPWDPWSFAAIGVLLTLTAVAAAAAPAVRAARIDPIVALRAD
ncbi:MAG TPA: ABC transporter permease [Vicinamibacterales bacterium]|nr:ABC transporter permease [Vicinamibacterales bacterium]